MSFAMAFERILITGCGGMLGRAVYPYFEQRCPNVLATDQNASGAWLEELDVRDSVKVEKLISEYRPDLVLHLAANTDLEYCETHGDFAHDNNAAPLTAVGDACERVGADLVYIGTAGIFDGAKEGYYSEQDTPNPLMVYGRSKLDGEVLARKACSRTYVVRAGWMVGGGPGIDHKFVSRVLAQLISGKREIRAVNDKWGTPTYTHDFALNLFELLETGKYGTYHMVCEGSGTRYDVAREIVSICGRQDVDVLPVSSDYFDREFFAPRPRSEMMINANLRALGINHMRHWKDALREYVIRDFADAVVLPEKG